MFAHAVTAPKAKTGSQATPARASTPLLTKKPQDVAGSTRADSQPVPGSAGQPLASDVQSFFSAAFGHDFSHVRIHADAPAAAAARALGANAYTVGAHIAFAPGLYQPTNPAGMRLLAHELAHVVQQRGGGGPPGAVHEQEADAASRAVVAGEEPRVRAPSQVGIAAQSEPPAVAKVMRTPFEQVMWFYHFYIDRLGYEYKGMGGNKGRLINPKGGHFVEVTLDPQSPRMVSVIVAGKSFEASEYNFASERFETRARHIEMVEYERELSIPERIGTGITVTAKVAGGAALCAWGTAETVGFGAVAACGYGADLAASALGDLRGEDSRTLSNRSVTAGLSEIVGDETAQQLTDNAEAAVNIMLGAYGAAKPPKAPVAVAGPRPSVPEIVAPEGSTGVPAVIESPGPPPASKTPIVEIRTPTTPDYGTPAASATPRAVSTRPMKKLPQGAHRGSMGDVAGTPVAHPQSSPTVEVRTPGTPDYGKPEYSVSPRSQGPDPWAAPPQPTKPPAPRAPRGHHQATGQAAKQAQAQGLEDLQKGRVGMQEHRTAPAVRAATGQVGQDVQSTHLVPQVVYKAINASPDLARTVNLPRPVNNAIDSFWVPKWGAATKLGTRVTGRDIRNWVSEGIRNVPESMLDKAAKNTLEWSLDLELKGLGITDETVIRPSVP
jgi:hypothetical protein